MKNAKIIFFAAMLFLAFVARGAMAGTATLTWTVGSESDLAGYKIYYGTSPRAAACHNLTHGYANVQNVVGKVGTYTFNNLADGVTYYFSVTAYDNASPANESCFSAEVNKAIPAITCTNRAYSSWSVCTNGNQTRTVTSVTPSGCTGGTTEALQQTCNSGSAGACTSFGYSAWSACMNGQRTRTITNAVPSGCSAANPLLQESCSNICTSWTYSSFGSCTGGVQTRSILSSFPAGCTGGNSSTQTSCTTSTTGGTTGGNTVGTTDGAASGTTTAGIITGGNTSASTATTPPITPAVGAGSSFEEQIRILAIAIRNQETRQQVAEKKEAILTQVYGKKASGIPVADKERISYYLTNNSSSIMKASEKDKRITLELFAAAFNGSQPKNDADWQDILRIQNGIYPKRFSKTAEVKALGAFRKIYGRNPNFKKKEDEKAIKMMAYGVRSDKRDLKKERAAITMFKKKVKKSPATVNDWIAVNAIAYSGVKK